MALILKDCSLTTSLGFPVIIDWLTLKGSTTLVKLLIYSTLSVENANDFISIFACMVAMNEGLF